jgi:hypothetical protein
MSTRTTLVLLALLILVGFAVYFIEFRKPAGGAVATPNAAGSATLLTLTAPAINSITVRDAVSNTQVSATRDVSSTWRLSDPAGQLADAATMDSLTGQLASIYVQRTLTPTGSLGEYGLLTPTLSVQIDLVSGSLSFAVGDMTPSQGAYYVHKPGDTHVYLVEAGLVDELRQLAEKPPVAATPTPVSSFPSPVGP